MKWVSEVAGWSTSILKFGLFFGSEKTEFFSKIA